jgi:hypothetical protein
MRKLFATAVGLALAISAHAQGLHAVSPLPGYECAMLNMTHEQMIDNSLVVPVYSSPSQASGRMGVASAILIVKAPRHVENGFAEILFPTGKDGWIDARWLAPMPNRPGHHCTPSVMSNGRPGIG